MFKSNIHKLNNVLLMYLLVLLKSVNTINHGILMNRNNLTSLVVNNIKNALNQIPTYEPRIQLNYCLIEKKKESNVKCECIT